MKETPDLETIGDAIDDLREWKRSEVDHPHTADHETEGLYTGSVAFYKENRAAHGNVCVTEHCSCGYQRRRNVNGVHVEQGPWHPGPELEERWETKRKARQKALDKAEDQDRRRKWVLGKNPSHREGSATWTLHTVDTSGVKVLREGRDSALCQISWGELRAAAAQGEQLGKAYRAILADAEACLEAGGLRRVPPRGTPTLGDDQLDW